MTAPWFCRRWVSRTRRCGARMSTQPDGTYRCPRCEPLPTADPEVY